MSDDDNVAPALCPFCGGSADVSGYDFAWYARCSTPGCWARVNGSLYEDAAEAIAAWNRRAGLEAVRREVLEEAAKVANELAALYRGYGSQRDRGAITCDRMFDHAATCADLANRIRALAPNPQEGAAEVEGPARPKLP